MYISDFEEYSREYRYYITVLQIIVCIDYNCITDYCSCT